MSIKNSQTDLEQVIDKIINEPFAIINDDKLSRSLGIYAKPLRDKGILHISSDDKIGETVVFLKCKNNYSKKGSISKRKGKSIDYIFDDILICKL